MKTAIAIIAIIMMLVFSIPAWAEEDTSQTSRVDMLISEALKNYNDDKKMLSLIDEALRLDPANKLALVVKIIKLYQIKDYRAVIRTIEGIRYLVPEVFLVALPYFVLAHQASTESNLILDDEVFDICKQMQPEVKYEIYATTKDKTVKSSNNEDTTVKFPSKEIHAEAFAICTVAAIARPTSDSMYKNIIDFATKGLSLNPSKKAFVNFFYKMRGVAYVETQQYRLGLEDLLKVNEDVSSLKLMDSVYYNARGRAYYELGQYNKAEQDFKQSLALEPNNPRAQEGLRRVNAARKYSKYISHFHDVLKRSRCTGRYRSIGSVTTFEIVKDVSVSYIEGGDLIDVKFPVNVSNQLLKIAKAKGFKIDINLDLPFVAWFTKNIIGGSTSDSPLALCYITALVRESQFNVLSELIDLYLEDSNLKEKK